MKIFNLFFAFLLLVQSSAIAQTSLWGMTSAGGTDGFGVIFKKDASNVNQTVQYSFNITHHGRNPNGDVCLASNGKLYGMTYAGGAFDRGVLFEYDPSTSTYTIKLDFDGTTNGSNPYGSFTEFGGKALWHDF